MAKPEQVLAMGRKLIGAYGRPNKFIAWYCARRNLKGAWLTAPWCAMFASFLGYSVGMPKEFGEFAHCPTWANWFKANKRWGKEPRVGAVVFFDWDRDGVADHVGIVSKVGTNQIKSLEGNTTVGKARNRVAEQTRGKSTVLGYGYPKYDSDPVTHTVNTGDTLSSIAKAWGVTWQDVYKVNIKLIGKDASVIKPGMTLTRP